MSSRNYGDMHNCLCISVNPYVNYGWIISISIIIFVWINIGPCEYFYSIVLMFSQILENDILWWDRYSAFFGTFVSTKGFYPCWHVMFKSEVCYSWCVVLIYYGSLVISQSINFGVEVHISKTIFGSSFMCVVQVLLNFWLG